MKTNIGKKVHNAVHKTAKGVGTGIGYTIGGIGCAGIFCYGFGLGVAAELGSSKAKHKMKYYTSK